MNFISSFLKTVLEWIYALVGNYGWSVILFTVLIRAILLPLDVKSKRGMRAMSAVQPKMQALQKKYANDKEKLNQKMNELYRKEKINPMAGCLPMLIQLPILFCMFTAMRVVANEETVRMVMNGLRTLPRADTTRWSPLCRMARTASIACCFPGSKSSRTD